MTDETLIPIAEAADKWGVTTRTVRRWIAAGQLKAFKKAGRTLVESERPEPVVVERVVSAMTTQEDNTSENLSHVRPANTEISAMLRRTERRTFCWQLLGMSCIVTIAALLSIIGAGWGIYSGTLQRLADNQATLAATRERAQAAEARAENAESRAAEIAREALKALRADEATEPEPTDDSWL